MAATVGTALGIPLGSRSGAGEQRQGAPEPSDTIMSGTRHETPVYVLEGEQSGPTAVVVGGLHGDERSGIRAAEAILRWTVEAGRLVVVPRANPVAIQRDTREGANGDLNRKFPPGQAPTTELARALWDRIAAAEPDTLVSLHSSKGLYGLHRDFVGQAVFPTEAGGAMPVAESAVNTVNDAVVPWYMPFHDFGLGHPLSGSAPLLEHKVGGDLGAAAHIVEVTEYLLDVETGAQWTEQMATELLTGHGIARAEGSR